MKKEDLRIKKTKKNLYIALATLMQKRAFEEIKVLDICKEAMINRSTFYDHFDDKYDLLDSLLKDLENELTKKLEENDKINSSKEYFMNMIELFFDYIDNNFSMFTPILIKNNNSVFMSMIYETCYKDVKDYMSKKKISNGNIPIDILAKFYVSGVINICVEYLKSTKNYKKEDLLLYLDQLLPNNIY